MARGNKVKGKNVAFHPNSRKAGQVLKRLAHDHRVSAQKKLRELKDKVWTEKIVWFQTAVEGRSRPVCPHQFDVLIDQFIARHEETISHLDDTMESRIRNGLKADELRRAMDDERQLYCTSGTELPDISSTKGFLAVKAWGSDIIDLEKIPRRKVNKKQLATNAVGSSCFNCGLSGRMEEN